MWLKVLLFNKELGLWIYFYRYEWIHFFYTATRHSPALHWNPWWHLSRQVHNVHLQQMTVHHSRYTRHLTIDMSPHHTTPHHPPLKPSQVTPRQEAYHKILQQWWGLGPWRPGTVATTRYKKSRNPAPPLHYCVLVHHSYMQNIIVHVFMSLRVNRSQ